MNSPDDSELFSELIDEIDKLTAQIKRLREDCSQAFDAACILAAETGYTDFGRPGGSISKLLDNLSAAAAGISRPHDDLLPFVLPTDRSNL